MKHASKEKVKASEKATTTFSHELHDYATNEANASASKKENIPDEDHGF